MPLTSSAGDHDRVDLWSGSGRLSAIAAVLAAWLPQGRCSRRDGAVSSTAAVRAAGRGNTWRLRP